MADKNLDKLLSETYTRESIGSYSGLKAVRKDPSRYITQTDKEGIYNMVIEILDNSLDETLDVIERIKGQLGENAEIEPLEISVYLNSKTGDCVISDQGRGVPMEMSKDYPDITTLNSLFEKDNTGGKGQKLDDSDNQGYSSKTMGVHGAGAFVVTACSEYLIVENRRFSPETGKIGIYRIEYQKGEPVESDEWELGRVQYLGEEQRTIGNSRGYTGLTVKFKPDLEVMSLYNPNTREIEEDYYLVDKVRTRIIETLHTVEDPLVVHFQVEGKPLQSYDSRTLSITHGLEEGVDFIKHEMEPVDTEMLQTMEERRVSPFSLGLIIRKAEDPNNRLVFDGYVNRIKVSESPHIDTVKSEVINAIARCTFYDPELDGFYRLNQLRGLKVTALLYVEKAQWGSQVKTTYTDYQVANFAGMVLARSGVLEQGGKFEPLIQYAFECSKPWLLAEKRKEEEMRRVLEEQDQQRRLESAVQQNVQSLNQSLRYLNKRGEFLYNMDIEESDLIIVEGESGSSPVQALMNKIPNIAVLTSVQGKIDNYNYVKREYRGMTLPEMEANGINPTPLDKLDVVLRAPFRRILLMSDNDADGIHIKALLRFYIWKEFRHLIENGRVFDISPNYCSYQAPPGLTYEYLGETKTLDTNGFLRTSEEYDVVRRTFPGKVQFILYEGVGSAGASEIERVLVDPNNWEQVPPLTTREEYAIHNLFTDSSQFKKVFTRAEYMTDEAIRKDRVRKVVYTDTTPKPEELLNYNLLSSVPVFTSTSRKNLEDYENKGSAVVEMNKYEELLGQATELY